MYTSERNIQLLIYLLKAKGIKNVIASPGGTNVSFVGSIQNDPFFRIISCVDERSAAYMACGIAAETKEPVVLSCTGATASRNYLPGLTEAYYRHLSVIAVTSSQVESHIGNLYPQAIDRSIIQNDVAVKSINMPVIKDSDDEWKCELRANEALIYLLKHGGGPVHINLETNFSDEFRTSEIKPCRIIDYIANEKSMPAIEKNKSIGIFIGSRNEPDSNVDDLIDIFCDINGAVVISDHTSNYHGRYHIASSLLYSQEKWRSANYRFDLVLHIGDISGDYYSLGTIGCSEVWRISEDGEIRDYFKKMTKIFEMPINAFFEYYSRGVTLKSTNDKYNVFRREYNELYSSIKDLPFSNISVAYLLHDKLPKNTVMHFGILNSLRSWNFFELDESIRCYCNVGGFGIDGALSSMIGASLSNPNQTYICVLGDLAFFYDINILFNRYVHSNIKIILINNGLGTEFMHYSNVASIFGEDTRRYIAAGGHNSQKAEDLVKSIAESLSFRYLKATNNSELNEVLESFLEESIGVPCILEVFTTDYDESEALQIIRNLKVDSKVVMKMGIRNTIGTKTISRIKSVLGNRK